MQMGSGSRSFKVTIPLRLLRYWMRMFTIQDQSVQVTYNDFENGGQKRP